MRLCNICDTPLLAGDICPKCKKICRAPVLISDNIKLNSSHPKDEEACDFHAHDRKSPLINQRHPAGERDCSYHRPGLEDDMTIRALLKGSRTQRRAAPSGGRKQKSGPSLVVVVFCIIIILLTALPLFIK